VTSWRYDCPHCNAFLLGIVSDEPPPKTRKCHKCGKRMVRDEIWQARFSNRREFAFDKPKRIHGLKAAWARTPSEAHAIMERHELLSHPADESGIVSPLGWAKETTDKDPVVFGLNKPKKPQINHARQRQR